MTKWIYTISLIFYFALFLTYSEAQEFDVYQSFQTDSNNVSWSRTAISSGLLCGSVGLIAFSIDEAYYQDQRVKFHFARDREGNLDWFDNRHRAMDKFGHVYSTSLFSQNLYFLARWSGYNNKTSSILASTLSIGLLGAMEVWDAHFERWGFSVGDFVANVAGGIYPVAQQNISFLQSIDYKMSYNFLRSKSPDHGLHDYENMTFWLTFNPRGMFNTDLLSWFPDWLNLAAGLGLESYQTQRHDFYISLDYNLKRIRSRYVLIRYVLSLLDRFHYPAPAIRLAPGYVGYGLFF